MLLNWAVTELNCYWTVTQLLLNWPVTELSCYSTVTGLLLNCYWTDLLLNWAVTQLLLDCYWTDLLLSCYWTVTLHCYLNCYCTGLFAFLNLRNSEVSQLNFLWSLIIDCWCFKSILYSCRCTSPSESEPRKQLLGFVGVGNLMFLHLCRKMLRCTFLAFSPSGMVRDSSTSSTI